MSALPDWLVERAALDEVPAASRDRLERADQRELQQRIAGLRAENEAEMAAYPAAQAILLIESRAADESKRRAARRRQVQLRWVGILGTAMAAAAVLLVLGKHDVSHPPTEAPVAAPEGDPIDITRAKGPTRLLAFRQVGDRAEQLVQDSVVRAGDLIQLSYNAGGKPYGVIASIDGAGVVTLHFPASEDARPEGTALAKRPTALPNAYVLDDAPRFERFFFITDDSPIDVSDTLAALRTFAARTDSATAKPDLPPGRGGWALRLRKPDHSSPTREERHD
ncbi:MAG TPA: hypothetical protein VFV99_01870 [Kofleriaceae bacterium]|nr:hypothetical protein [Kofleriaceae bacterium]